MTLVFGAVGLPKEYIVSSADRRLVFGSLPNRDQRDGRYERGLLVGWQKATKSRAAGGGAAIGSRASISRREEWPRFGHFFGVLLGLR